MMELRRPLCGNTDAHDPHGLWNCGYTAWNECPGWSVTDADTVALIRKMDDLARGWAWPLSPPSGACLYCHPVVYRALTQAWLPSFDEFKTSLKTGEDLMRTTIPVAVVTELEYGAWTVDSDAGVIAEGKIRDERTAVAHG